MDAFVRKLPRADTDDESSQNGSHYDSASERPPKRIKQDEIKNSESENSEESTDEAESRIKAVQGKYATGDDDASNDAETTAFENVLPPTQTDDHAIEEYEQMKSSQREAEEDGTTEKTKPLWIKGRSSIYVDAFNLALDTVLEEESQLFDKKEMEVFKKWKALTYEAQYL